MKTPTALSPSKLTDMPVSSPSFIPGTPIWIHDILQRASQQYNIPTIILSALLKQESNFRPDAVSPVGARGIAQFMPETSRELGVNPDDPEESIMGMAKYLRDALDQFGDIKLALASYNAGAGAVAHYGGIPPYQETQDYVKNILAMAGDPHASFNQPRLEMLNDMKKQSQKAAQTPFMNQMMKPKPSFAPASQPIPQPAPQPAPQVTPLPGVMPGLTPNVPAFTPAPQTPVNIPQAIESGGLTVDYQPPQRQGVEYTA